MKIPGLLFSRFVLATLLLAGCTNSDPEVYNGPAISLSSLEEAEKELAETAKRIDQSDRLHLPAVFDEAVWGLQPCTPTPPTRTVNLSNAIPAKVDIWGLAVSPESGKALVTYRNTSKGQPAGTVGGAYCDVSNGRVLSTFDLPDYAAPYSIDPTGKYAILSRADGYLSERHSLYVAELGVDQVLLRKWRPLVDPSVEIPKSYIKEEFIRWATFVGENRMVTVNDAGTLHIWKFPELARVGSFKGIDGLPALSPDKQQVVFVAGDTLVLLDPDTPQILGYRRFGPPPQNPVVAVHPDGRRVAVGGKGGAMIADLSDGSYFRISPDGLDTRLGSKLISDFAFIGPFLHDGRQLFDFDTPCAVWSIGRNQWDMPIGDSYWSVVWHNTKGTKFGSRKLALCALKIPYQEIRRRISDVRKTSDVFALQAGDSIRLDVSGIPIEHRSKIRETLIHELANKGFIPADSAEVTVQAFLDSEQQFKATYVHTNGSPITPLVTKETPEDQIVRVTYRGRYARLWIVKDGRQIWKREGMERPGTWLDEEDVQANGKLDFYGEPKYSIFSKPDLPDYLPGDYRGVLGKTNLSVDGITTRQAKPAGSRK